MNGLTLPSILDERTGEATKSTLTNQDSIELSSSGSERKSESSSLAAGVPNTAEMENLSHKEHAKTVETEKHNTISSESELSTLPTPPVNTGALAA